MPTATRPHISLPKLPVGRGLQTRASSRPNRMPRRFLRRRLALIAGLLAAAVAIAVAVVLLIGGSGPVPPATGAATVVPADALAYVHLSTDPSRSAVSDARKLAARFPDWPLLETAALNRLRGLVAGPSSADITTAVRPWLGKEIGLALIADQSGGAQPLAVLDVARAAGARSFVSRAGATPAGAYDGARIMAYPSGSELAFVGHYLLAGSDAGVRAALRSARRRAPVLPSGSTLMLDVDGLGQAAPGLLSAAATAGIAGNVGPLLRRVGSALTAQGINVKRVVSLFDGETAVAISPGPNPALLIVSRVRDQTTARSALAALEGPVTALFSPAGSAGGQVPELADRVIGGATVHEVGLGPGLQLDYAV